MTQRILLYNTATRQKEEFTPIAKGKVGLYCCGPTVYHFAHIGNMRTYVFEDLLVRMFHICGYQVKHVMNITDVGHLTSDSDEGEDKMLKGAKRENKTVWQIAQEYTDAFFKDAEDLYILKPTIACKATEHIPQMQEMVEMLEEKGYTYIADGNVYFDTSKYPDYVKFANLQLDDQGKSRVGIDENKKHPKDFVLWFTKSKFEDQAMKWDSKWGVGYPGWHIECSAMSTYYLGKTFDIHCGGVDHVSIHHSNEIAQSCCAHDSKFVNYWMHGEFLIDQTGKMSKSKGEFLTVQVLKQKGYNPLAYRYLLLQTHYRKQLQFSFDALDAAQRALDSLYKKVLDVQKEQTDKGDIKKYQEQFVAAITDDLNVPKALGILHEVLGSSELGTKQKYEFVCESEALFGLGLADVKEKKIDVPDEVQVLLEKRKSARAQKDFAQSDALRDEIAGLGFIVKDVKGEQVIEKK